MRTLTRLDTKSWAVIDKRHRQHLSKKCLVPMSRSHMSHQTILPDETPMTDFARDRLFFFMDVLVHFQRRLDSERFVAHVTFVRCKQSTVKSRSVWTWRNTHVYHRCALTNDGECPLCGKTFCDSRLGDREGAAPPRAYTWCGWWGVVYG